MNSRAQSLVLPIVVALLLGAAWASGPEKDPAEPKTPAEKIAGRWRITLNGLPDEHQPVLASLAVEGEILLGTLTVGRKTLPVSAGSVAGDRFKFEFRHMDAGTFRMRGRIGFRGLVGSWEAGDLKGKWSARPLN